MTGKVAGMVELLRGAGMSQEELQAAIDEKFSMVDLVVIDSGPGKSADQGTTIGLSDFVTVVRDSSWGADEGAKKLSRVCKEAGSHYVVVSNRGEHFPEVAKLQGKLKSGEVPKDMRHGIEALAERIGDARIVGVVGGKGGVGKTTIAACLALSIANDGGKVLVVDMDNQEGCISRVLSGKEMSKGERHKWIGRNGAEKEYDEGEIE